MTEDCCPELVRYLKERRLYVNEPVIRGGQKMSTYHEKYLPKSAHKAPETDCFA